jgi:hypothetical protein
MRGRHQKPPRGRTLTVGIGLAMATVVAVGHGAGAASPEAPRTPLVPSDLLQTLDGLPPPLTERLDQLAALTAPAGVGIHPALRPAAAPLVRPAFGMPTGQIPAAARDAYARAAARAATLTPGCRLTWSVLAGIGFIESGQARDGGSDAAVWDGIARPAIVGPALDGKGFAAVPDTDRGSLDGDPVWDRAVGPMQFLPQTWRAYGADGDGDGVRDPENIRDAAAAAAGYLCADGLDLGAAGDLIAAVFSYNHSLSYVHAVLAAAQSYDPAAPTTAAALRVLPLDPPGTAATPAVLAPRTTRATPVRPTAPVPTPVPSPTGPSPPATPSSPTSQAKPLSSPTPTSQSASSPDPVPTPEPTTSAVA